MKDGIAPKVSIQARQDSEQAPDHWYTFVHIIQRSCIIYALPWKSLSTDTPHRKLQIHLEIAHLLKNRNLLLRSIWRKIIIIKTIHNTCADSIEINRFKWHMHKSLVHSQIKWVINACYWNRGSQAQRLALWYIQGQRLN